MLCVVHVLPREGAFPAPLSWVGREGKGRGFRRKTLTACEGEPLGGLDVNRTARRRCRKRRKRNRGWFLKGYDHRRRRGFSREECQRGYRACLVNNPHLCDEWIHYRLKAPRKPVQEVPW